jgi:hypothetical protein
MPGSGSLSPRNPAPHSIKEAVRRATQITLLSLHATALEIQDIGKRTESDVRESLGALQGGGGGQDTSAR